MYEIISLHNVWNKQNSFSYSVQMNKEYWTEKIKREEREKKMEAIENRMAFDTITILSVLMFTMHLNFWVLYEIKCLPLL